MLSVGTPRSATVSRLRCSASIPQAMTTCTKTPTADWATARVRQNSAEVNSFLFDGSDCSQDEAHTYLSAWVSEKDCCNTDETKKGLNWHQVGIQSCIN
eukprot:6467928-Amphidinium_carterae.1